MFGSDERRRGIWGSEGLAWWRRMIFRVEWYILRCCCQSFLGERGKKPPCCRDLVVWYGRGRVHVWSMHWAIVLVMDSRVSHISGQCCGKCPTKAV